MAGGFIHSPIQQSKRMRYLPHSIGQNDKWESIKYNDRREWGLSWCHCGSGRDCYIIGSTKHVKRNVTVSCCVRVSSWMLGHDGGGRSRRCIVEQDGWTIGTWWMMQGEGSPCVEILYISPKNQTTWRNNATAGTYYLR